MSPRPLLLAAALVAAGCDSDSQPGPPETARIVKVAVLDAPLADPATGDGWDGGGLGAGGPEVYFRLFDADVDLVTDPGADRLNPRDDAEVFAVGSESPWFADVDARDFPLVWDVDPGYRVRRLDDELYVGVFDYDPTTGDDPMAETVVFRLSDVAPDLADGRADAVDLEGFDLDGNPVNVDVRLTVVFED